MIDGLLLYLFILIITEFNNSSCENTVAHEVLKYPSLTMLSSAAHHEGEAFSSWHRMELSGRLHTLTTLFPVKEHLVPTEQETRSG